MSFFFRERFPSVINFTATYYAIRREINTQTEISSSRNDCPFDLSAASALDLPRSLKITRIFFR